MRILITGGTGFIGSQLAYSCLNKGYAVRVLGQTNNEAEKANLRKLKEAGVECVICSITDKPKVGEALKGIDAVFHLAAAQHEMNVPDEHFWKVNVDGTKTLLRSCLERGVKFVLHGSTIGVYGELRGVITEESPCRPDNIYGITKFEGEKVARSYADRIAVSIIRIPEVYGPGDRRLLKLFKAVRGGRFIIPGKGKNLHHPIFVRDLIDGFFCALEKKEAKGETFLLSGPRPVTTEEMVECVAGALNVQLKVIHVPFWPFWAAAFLMEKTLRPLGIQPPLHRRRMDFFKKSFELSSRKARELLGFEAKTDFAQGARLTAEWYEKEGLL